MAQENEIEKPEGRGSKLPASLVNEVVDKLFLVNASAKDDVSEEGGENAVENEPQQEGEV